MACMSRAGREPGFKKQNQDNCFAFEKYITNEQSLFGAFDGHGPNGAATLCLFFTPHPSATCNIHRNHVQLCKAALSSLTGSLCRMCVLQFTYKLSLTGKHCHSTPLTLNGSKHASTAAGRHACLAYLQRRMTNGLCLLTIRSLKAEV